MKKNNYCNHCGSAIVSDSSYCMNCGVPLSMDIEAESGSTNFINTLSFKQPLALKGNTLKTTIWFILANSAVVLSLVAISGGELIPFAPFIILMGTLFPFISLLLSKSIAKRIHGIHLIDQNAFKNSYEENLYKLITELSHLANLNVPPEIGIYESSDMNAFATGYNRNHSLIAFSTAILRDMSDEEIAAVAGHEISHIANGDMVTMTLLQSLINSFILIITLPINIFKILAFFSDDIGSFAYSLIVIVKNMISTICLFFGNLIMMAFSQKREFEADKLAARLVDKDAMINALVTLSSETVFAPKKQSAYASFKINSKPAIFDIFSTHPSIERRIESLKKLDIAKI